MKPLNRNARLRLRRKLARAAMLAHWIDRGRRLESARRFSLIAFG